MRSLSCLGLLPPCEASHTDNSSSQPVNPVQASRVSYHGWWVETLMHAPGLHGVWLNRVYYSLFFGISIIPTKPFIAHLLQVRPRAGFSLLAQPPNHPAAALVMPPLARQHRALVVQVRLPQAWPNDSAQVPFHKVVPRQRLLPARRGPWRSWARWSRLQQPATTHRAACLD